MYVFFYFSATIAQIKALKHIKADKKEAVKNNIVIGHANNTLYRYNKCYYNLHAHCTLNIFNTQCEHSVQKYIKW